MTPWLYLISIRMFIQAENLRVLQLAERFSDGMWPLVKTWDRFHQDTLGKQLVRAVDSIGANIAEGFGRHHPQDTLRFYYIARGSLEETGYWLKRAESRCLVSKEKTWILMKELDLLSKTLNAFISAQKNRNRTASESLANHPII